MKFTAPRISAAAIVLCAVLLLAGCASGEPSAAPAPPPSEPAALTVSSAPQASAAPTQAPSTPARSSSLPSAPPSGASSEASAPSVPEAAGPAEVRVQWLVDSGFRLSSCRECILIEGDPQAWIVFSTDLPVGDFRLLSVAVEDIDEKGNISFSDEELRRFDELTPDTPLVVATVFYGDMPNNGFSYVDADGTTRRFAVDMSGYDGSLTAIEY